MQEFTVRNENCHGTYILDGKAFIIVKIYPDIIKSKQAFLREKAELVRKGKNVVVKLNTQRKIEKKKGYKTMIIMGKKVRIEE